MVNISNLIPSQEVENLIEEGGKTLCIPDGIYTVKIMDSAFRDSKADKAIKRLCFAVVIVEGQFTHSEFEIGLNVMNKNETARRIAQSDYARICKACGYPKTQEETNVLHNIAFNVEMKQKKQDNWKDDNGVEHEGVMRSEPAKYLAIKGNAAQTETKKEAATQAAGKKPWEN